MFVDEQKSLAGLCEIAALKELAPVGVELVGEFAGVADEMVHRNRAEARAVIGEGNITGTFINGDALAHVFAEERFGNEELVGVVGLCAPGLNAVDPVIVLGFGLTDAVVVNIAIIVVIGIKLPAEGELLYVVDAGDAFALFLGLAEGGQEEPGEDRNDGDDDEEFDEGESR